MNIQQTYGKKALLLYMPAKHYTGESLLILFILELEKSSYNESELLKLVAGGNAAAFKILVDLYWNRIYGNTLALTKSPQVAEELTQDIFVKIWNQRESLPDVHNFSVYLYVLGRNQVLSAMRKKIIDSSAPVPGYVPEDMQLPDLQLELKETYQLILEGIEQLSPVRKKVFKLSRMDGRSYDEISRDLGISRNTVKEHIVNALNFLRTYILARSGKTLLLLFMFLAGLLK